MNKLKSFFKYTNSIGIPKRQTHKIAEFEKGKAIQFKISGKEDFTMSRGKQRTYSEYDYVIQFIGTANKVQFSDPNKILVAKNIPRLGIKIINERNFLF